MNKNSVIDYLSALLCETLETDRNSVSENDDIIDNLGADSLDVVQMLVTAEEHFNVDFDDDEITDLKTINDVAEYILSKL